MTGYALAVLAVYAISRGRWWAHLQIPRIADMLLSRAYLRSYTWWYRCLDDFSRYRDVFPGPASPSKREGVCRRRGHVARGLPFPGSEGDAHARTRRSASGGGHRRGQGRLGAKRGSSSGGAARSPRGRGSGRCSPPPWRCGSRPSRCSGAPWHQGCLAVRVRRGHGVGGGVRFAGKGDPVGMLRGACSSSGGAYQLLRHGSAGIAEGAVAAAAVLAVCWTANRIARKSGGSVGFGDIRCMTALAFACGPATLLGRGGLLCIGVRVLACRDVGASAWPP